MGVTTSHEKSRQIQIKIQIKKYFLTEIHTALQRLVCPVQIRLAVMSLETQERLTALLRLKTRPASLLTAKNRSALWASGSWLPRALTGNTPRTG